MSDHWTVREIKKQLGDDMDEARKAWRELERALRDVHRATVDALRAGWNVLPIWLKAVARGAFVGVLIGLVISMVLDILGAV